MNWRATFATSLLLLAMDNQVLAQGAQPQPPATGKFIVYGIDNPITVMVDENTGRTWQMFKSGNEYVWIPVQFRLPVTGANYAPQRN